ncbi:MAG: diguanylate cyclase [Spirochaetales bacterium]|nr:diguanylate cyclase [Spirochaetales bacterium]
MELKIKFLNQLPERRKEVEKKWEQLRGLSMDSQELSYLRMLIHRLAGTGSSFSCFGLSDYARNAVALIDRFLYDKQTPTEEALEVMDDYITRMFEEIEEPLEECPEESESEKTLTLPDKKNLAFYVHRYEKLAEDFQKQLGFYGYNVRIYSSLEDARASMDTFSRILIIESDIIKEHPDYGERLLNLKSSYSNMKYIFIAEDDGFDIRLQCVRSGGDDFFLLPLDVSRLIDRINSITAKENTEPYHILIVDDDPEQVSYFALILQQAGMITSVASDPKRVIHILIEAKPELILMDMYMKECNGSELAAIIRQQEAFVGIPIVYLSFETDKEKQMAAIRRGGDDFLTKPIKSEHLISAVSTRAERTRNLRFFMERDSLTGLLNHTNLKEQLNREIMRAERTGSELCFAMIDLDHFKMVNDSYGHITGDRVLKSLSRMLLERLRRTDIIGRYGGEEFGVILLNTDEGNAFIVMDQIRKNFAQIHHQSGNQSFHVTLSCGIASFPASKDSSQLTTLADRGLYQAKEQGRNRVISVEAPET